MPERSEGPAVHDASLRPRVGVILSSFERPEGLKRAIISLQRQSYQRWVCVIADDHSEDPGVAEVCAWAKETDGRFFVLSGHPKFTAKQKAKVCSFSRHINSGLDWLDRVGVEFVSYLLDDVEYHRGRLESHVRFLDAHPDVWLVWGEQWLIELDRDGRVRRERKQVPRQRDNHAGMTMKQIRDRLSRQNILNHCSAMHRPTEKRWSLNPAHWSLIDLVFWRAHAWEKEFRHLAVVGETMTSTPDDIGPMMHLQGKTIVDVARARAKRET